MIGRRGTMGVKVLGLIVGLALLVGVGGILPVAWAQEALTNGVGVNRSVSSNQNFGFRDFSIVVPPGATQLTATLTNLSGDADLLVSFNELPGAIPVPGGIDYIADCASFFEGTANEICQFTNPQPGTWFISAFAFAPGTHSFTVTATFQTGSGGGGSAEAFVTRLYEEVLDRAPDPAGLQAFINQIAQFGSVVPTTIAFFHSAEFLARNTSFAEFLTICYQTFLNRDPDPAGFNAFLTALQTDLLTRDNILAIFIDSEEFAALASFLPPLSPQEDFVTTLYVEILGRGPDQPGLQGFVAQLQQNCDLLSLIRNFLNAPEFLMQNTSNTEYVTILYRVLLDRVPDLPGLTGFVTQLNQGTTTREQLLNQFAASAEFQAIEVEICGTPPPPPPPPPPGGGISGTYATTGTLAASSACGFATTQFPVPSFNLTINQSGSTFTGSGTVNTSIQGIPIQATINLNGTVSPTNQLSGPFTLNISALGQSIPVNGTFTGSVSGNTITLNGSGTVPPIPGVTVPPGCSFSFSLTGTR